MSTRPPLMLRGLLLLETVMVLIVLGHLARTYIGSGGAVVEVVVPAQPPPIRTTSVFNSEDEGGDQGVDQLRPDDSLDPRIHEAVVALAESRVEDAKKLFRALAGERPTDAEVQTGLGLALMRSGDPAGAGSVLSIAAGLDPGAITPRFALGTLHLQEGRPGEAVPWFDAVITLNAYHVGAHLNRGVALARLGEHERAAREYEEATRLDRSPDGAKAWYNLALVRLRQGRSSEALTALTSGLRLKPDHEPSRLKRAVVLARIGLKDEAVDEYGKLLDVAPDHLVALTNLGALLLGLGRPAQAEEPLRKAYTSPQPPSRAAYNLGICLLQLERPDEAVPVFQAAVAQDPAHAPSSYNLGIAYFRSGSNAKAASAFATACALAPDQVEYKVNWGLALAGSGDEAGAVKRYAEAVAEQPDYFKAWLLLGKTRRHLSDLDGSIESLTQAVTLQADSRTAWHLLGEAHLRRGDLIEAERAMIRSLALEESSEDLALLAEIQMAMGTPAKAEETLRRVLALVPTDGDANKQLAMILVERSAWGEVLRCATLVAEQKPESPLAFNLGLRAYHEERYAEALDLFILAARLPRRAGAAGHMQGLCLLALGRPAEAVTVLVAAKATDPENLRVASSLARAQRQAGDLAGAILTLEAATAADSATSSHWRLLCESLVEAGRVAEALVAGERAIALAPQDVEPVIAHARALVADGQRDEAIRRVRNLLTIHPEAPDLQAFLAAYPP